MLRTFDITSKRKGQFDKLKAPTTHGVRERTSLMSIISNLILHFVIDCFYD